MDEVQPGNGQAKELVGIQTTHHATFGKWDAALAAVDESFPEGIGNHFTNIQEHTSALCNLLTKMNFGMLPLMLLSSDY